MNTAIITGATGFIGSTLTNYLLNNNYKVIALGRCNFDQIKLNRLKVHENLIYLKIPMEKISKLKDFIYSNKEKLEINNSIFFHFAWGGNSQLSDLNIEAQLQNVIYSENAFKVAKEINCKKFIFVGTMEEFFTQKYLQLDYKKDKFYNRHVIYALAKTAARKALKLSYQGSNTDLIFATNSHVMGPKDERDSFLQVSLKKLVLNQKLLLTNGEQYFDVISSFDCCKAYKLLGERGISGEEYWIGSGEPKLLKEYILMMSDLYPNDHSLDFGSLDFNDIGLDKSQFSISKLVRDTDFKVSLDFKEIVKELKIYLFKKI